MSIIIQNISFQHPDGDVLFSGLSFSLELQQKMALVGDNGSGKSTLLRLIAEDIPLLQGSIISQEPIYLVPQDFTPYLNNSVADVLKISDKLHALQEILNGNVDIINFETLGDDWELEERVKSEMEKWGLQDISLDTPLNELSGGEKTKVFLAGLTLNKPGIVLMDEPTNHLDSTSRILLYTWLKQTTSSVLVVSHDRELLNLLSGILELSSLGLKYYSGNYEAYKEQKDIELGAIHASLKNKETERKQAQLKQQKVAERKQKADSRGQKLSARKGIGKMAMDTRQDRAEKTSARFQADHQGKVEGISSDIREIKNKIAEQSVLKLHLESSSLPENKLLVEATDVNYSYNGDKLIWKEALSFKLWSGERVLLKGCNGSGKTTLIRLITEMVLPTQGTLKITPNNWLYLDQEYSFLDGSKTVYEQAQAFNSKLPEHEVKCMLHRSQLSLEFWDQPCSSLSGGEKMKLSLCSLLISSVAPDLMILDEPTNNIDMHSIAILTQTLSHYKGTLLLVSHDRYFVEELGIDREINLD